MIEWGTFAIGLGVFAAVVAVIWYAKSRGPKTAKGVHRPGWDGGGREDEYPKQDADDNGN